MFAQLLDSVEITRFRCFDENFGFQEQGIVRLPAWCRWGRCNRGCIAAHDIEPLISRSKAPYLRTSTLIVSNNMHTSPFLGSQLQRRAPSAARTTGTLYLLGHEITTTHPSALPVSTNANVRF